MIAQLLDHIGGAAEAIPCQQRRKAVARTAYADISAQSTQAAKRQSLLLGIELPGMEVQHSHGHGADVAALSHCPFRQPQREHAEVAAAAHWQIQAEQMKRRRW